MGDQLQRQVVDARHARHRSVDQARKLAVVAARQVPAGEPGLLFDQVVVVDEPLGRRGDLPPTGDRIGQQGVGIAQHLLVVVEPGQKPVVVRSPRRADPVPVGQRQCVPLELTDAEQLGAQRRLVGRRALALLRKSKRERS
jgi:hypothetical protein